MFLQVSVVMARCWGVRCYARELALEAGAADESIYVAYIFSLKVPTPLAGEMAQLVERADC